MINDNGSPVVLDPREGLRSARFVVIGNIKFCVDFVLKYWPCRFRKFSKEEIMNFTHWEQ